MKTPSPAPSALRDSICAGLHKLTLASLILMGISALEAGLVEFDGDGTGQTALATAANWTPNALPTTNDQAIFTDAVFGGPLPASLTNGSAQTWGNLIWNSNSSTVISGAGSLTLSGSGANVNGDLITLGSNVSSGTLTISTSGNALYRTGTGGNLNVVNAGASLVITSQANMPDAVVTKTGAGTVTFGNGNNAGGGVSAKFILDGGTVNFLNAAGFGGGTTTNFEIRNGTFLDNSTGAGITLSRNFTQTWAGDFTFKGSGASLDLGTGAVTLTGSRKITSATAGRTLTVGGSIGDGGNAYGLTKAGPGNLTLTAANTFTGPTASYGGILTLGFNAASAPVSNIISSSSGLVLGAATVNLTGKAATANTQTFNGITVEAGASQFTATSGASGGSMNVTAGTVVRETGGTLNFTLPTSGAISVSNVNDAGGLFGPGVTVGKNDWATISGGNVVAFTAYTTANAVGTWAADQNITTSAATTGSLGASTTLNSLRLAPGNNASNVNLGGNTLTVRDGILVAGATQQQTISNGTLRGANGELVLINNNSSFSLGGPQYLTISANIVDNGGATALTVSTNNGNRPVQLSGSNSYTGTTTVSAGTLLLNAATNNIASSSAINLVNGAVLDVSNVSSGFILAAGQKLIGNGTVAGAITIGSGATLAIGNSPGTMSFEGDLTLAPGSTGSFEINGLTAGLYDLAQGGAGVQSVTFGGDLNLLFEAGFNTVGTIKIFDFENYSGTFSNVTTSGLAGGYTASFDALTGTVTVSVVPEPAAVVLIGFGVLLTCGFQRKRRGM